MTVSSIRFDMLLGPDGLWSVWDKVVGTPVEFAGRPLVGMSEKEARCAIEVIEQILSSREQERRGDAA